MTTATTLPTVSARPASAGHCSCITAPVVLGRACSRKPKWLVAGRLYCEQHLPMIVTIGTGKPGARKFAAYTVIKSA